MPTVTSSMLLLCMLIIWKIQAVPQYQLNMYNTNNQQDEYCLISYTVDGTYDFNDPMHMPILIHQTISYCLGTSEEVNFIGDWNFRNTIESSFTFDELKEKNITSQMLLSWSASIDLAEQYQIFLDSDSNLLSDKEVVFHNCTSLWFGPSCRFAFDCEIDKPFYEIVDTVFKSKFEVVNDTKVTCYEHFHCDTVLSCLDWREICDGKSDCLDGSDENNCWQLEVKECANNEFRCHNGQCIPFEFFHDNLDHPDCLDRTDERPNSDNTGDCYKTPNFNCEEHMCRPGNDEFSCGDGQCTNGIERCHNGRKILLASDFFSDATACYMNSYTLVDFERCTSFCLNSSCIKDNFTTQYEIRYMLLLFGHVRFIFSNDLTPNILTLPDYVCYDKTLCTDFLPEVEPIDNLTCRHFDDLVLRNTDSYANNDTFFKKIKDRFRTCLIASNETFYCHYSTMYQCQNSSKCISKQRLLDGIHDCPYEDDETFNQSCSLTDVRHRFNCSVDGIEKCFASLVLEDRKEDCTNNDDEWDQEKKFTAKHIYFQTICDGKQDLSSPILINGQNETDETDCEHWPCNNTYSRCDGFWLCKNGSDEVNCLTSTCPEFHHDCVFPNYTSNVSCLPIARAGDGQVDCLGATDEREGYFESLYRHVEYYFRCRNHTEYIKVDRGKLCNNKSDCQSNDDEIFCTSFASQADPFYCQSSSDTTDAERFLRDLVCPPIERPPMKYFKLGNILTFPLPPTIDRTSTIQSISVGNDSLEPNPGIISPLDTEMILMNINPIEQCLTPENKHDNAWWCNRGVPIRIRMDGNTSELHCLCPQSYYGDKCQYQNQRVSLTLRIRMTSEWRTIFILLITLIDNERNIQSYNHIQYLPVQDCADKFNIYLLYSTRPKNSSRNYSVQIDVFNHVTFNYRASWIFPLPFSFLPVHRLPVSLTAPFSNIEPVEQCSPPCNHGHCFHYINDPNSTFCRCESGWSGAQCDIEQKCDCAPGSLCISNSTCLCPLGRFGPRCYLLQDSCRSDSCMNGGTCVPMDVRHETANLKKFVCICLEGYEGDRCEDQQKQTQIDISFHHKLSIPPSLLIHFIAVQDKQPIRTTVMKKIAFDQHSLTLFTSISFDIAFAQIFRHYYLIILQKEIVTSPHVRTEVIPSHRCRSITELFNDTFTSQHLLKRIKYYHIPCKQHPELVCFFDEIHLCLCTLDRTANCFEFDHNATYNCVGRNYCENGGHCFLDNRTCPKSSSCVCPKCYFGSKCQFSTKGFSLSLDTILGYHIHTKTEISQQPAIVKVAIALITIMFISGFINSILSFRTFQEEETRTVGCGLYLFASSIMSMIIVIVLILKFSFLVASHMGSIKNGLFLRIQCISTDFLLRILLSTNDWLNACVSIEQTINVLKGIKFDKAKSKLVAKWMIFIISISTSCTLIYDPIHRRLIDDAEEECTWCITQYSSSVHKYDSFINIFHFSVPFAINCISALIVIITAARIRSNSQKAKPFKKYLHDQLKYHKQLLISPSILITLALPQLVISFLSGCMKSARDPWFYLFGYFISFIPSITTFVVFILPSETYMKAFNESIRRIWYR